MMIGLVSSLEDPDGLSRVQVTFPQLNDQPSEWARMSTPMAGKDRGFHFLPEVDDEVLVGFEQGDIRRPYILGGLWSSVDKPPANDGNATENNWRFIVSRSGHLVKLDDTAGAERIEVVGKDAKHKLIIDVAGDKIQIQCDSGDIELKAKGAFKVEAESVEIKASGKMLLEASGKTTVKGSTVELNP